MEQEGPQHTQLSTTGIFQLNLERTHWKCFHKRETVRKIFISGISSNDRNDFGMIKEPLQAKLTLIPTWPLQTGLCHGSFGTELPGANWNPCTAAGGGALHELWGLLEVHCVRHKNLSCGCSEQAADRNPRKKTSWKWQEGISNWEGGGKRKGKAYKEMEVFTGMGDQVQRKIFFFCSFVYNVQS